MTATTISTVAVAAMVLSDSGPHKPLTIAGAILLPDGQSGATSPATTASRPSASPRRTPATSPSAGSTGNSPVAKFIPAASTGRTGAGFGTPAATSHVPAAAGAPAPTTSRTPTPHPSEPATPRSSRSNSNSIAHALFTALNNARRDAGLEPLTWNPRLQRSAAGHNEAMAEANQLSSRVGNEPALGVRQANQGVLGSYAAEVVGYTGTMNAAGALAVQQAMLDEQAPDDSHRQTLLSSAVDMVGIDVLLDPAHGRLWITEDFARLP